MPYTCTYTSKVTSVKRRHFIYIFSYFVRNAALFFVENLSLLALGHLPFCPYIFLPNEWEASRKNLYYPLIVGPQSVSTLILIEHTMKS